MLTGDLVGNLPQTSTSGRNFTATRTEQPKNSRSFKLEANSNLTSQVSQESTTKFNSEPDETVYQKFALRQNRANIY